MVNRLPSRACFAVHCPHAELYHSMHFSKVLNVQSSGGVRGTHLAAK